MLFTDLIITYDNVLSDDFCSHLINKFENDENKTRGVVGSGYREDIKKSTDLHISHYDGWKEEDEKLYESLSQYSGKYIEILKVPYMRSSGIQVRARCYMY